MIKNSSPCKKVASKMYGHAYTTNSNLQFLNGKKVLKSQLIKKSISIGKISFFKALWLIPSLVLLLPHIPVLNNT